MYLYIQRDVFYTCQPFLCHMVLLSHLTDQYFIARYCLLSLKSWTCSSWYLNDRDLHGNEKARLRIIYCMKGYYESELGANRAEIGGKERFYLSYKFITHEADPRLSFTSPPASESTSESSCNPIMEALTSSNLSMWTCFWLETSPAIHPLRLLTEHVRRQLSLEIEMAKRLPWTDKRHSPVSLRYSSRLPQTYPVTLQRCQDGCCKRVRARSWNDSF